MSKYTFTVEVLKTRLDKHLAERLSEFSRSRIQRDIEAEQVTVNGKIIKEPKHVVRKGDKIIYKPVAAKQKLKPVNVQLKTLYNDHGLLIIDKPPGLVVHPGAGFKGDSLADALLYQFKDIKLVGEEGRSGIVHRLDKDTSGVMLIALTQPMYEYLKDAFAERKIKKEYIALVCGKLVKQHGFIDSPLGKSKTDFRKMSTKNFIEAKESLTEYWVLEHLHSPPHEGEREGVLANTPSSTTSPNPSSRGGEFSGVDSYTLVRVKLHTGRTHQIRVHFSSLGHPLAGDKLYAGERAVLPGLPRQFLHAEKIEVQLPNRTWIEAESDLPEDLRKVLKALNSKVVNQL